MADDACSDVKSDLEAGTYENYVKDFPIYIDTEGKFEGGNVFIYLRRGTRDPVQTVNGSVFYTPRSCLLQIVATSKDNRDKLYDDVENILTSTSRGYTLKRGRDEPFDDEHYSITIQVNMLL